MLMIFDKLEQVPEALRKDAKEVDGKFHLEGEGLVTKNKELLTELTTYKEAASKLKEFGDLDPKKAKAALEQLTSLDEQRRALDAEIQKAVQANAADWDKKIKAVEVERDAMRSNLEERIIDADLSSAISSAEGDPFFVSHHLKSNVKTFVENGKYVAKVVDPATGKPRLNSKGEPMNMAELVAEAKADKKFAPAFKAPAASGSGAQPGAATTTQGNGQAVTLTREQAKDNRVYRQALETVKGDASKIVVKD